MVGPQAKQAAADAEAEALSGDSGDTEGFLFGRLVERRPEAKAGLLAFREALLASASGDQKLKVGGRLCRGHRTQCL